MRPFQRHNKQAKSPVAVKDHPVPLPASLQIFGPQCQFLLGQHFVFLQRPANLRRRSPATQAPGKPDLAAAVIPVYGYPIPAYYGGCG